VEWYDALIAHFRYSRNVRLWFVQNILFAQPSRLSEYLLESPSSEVRVYTGFVQILEKYGKSWNLV